MGARDARTQGAPIVNLTIGATEDAADRPHSAAWRHSQCFAKPSYRGGLINEVSVTQAIEPTLVPRA